MSESAYVVFVHESAPRKAVPISLVSDSTTPRGGKRGPSTLCVPRNQAHMNGEGGPVTKGSTPKAVGGAMNGNGLESGLSWSPSSAPTTPSGKGDGVPSLPFAQVRVASLRSSSICSMVPSRDQLTLASDNYGPHDSHLALDVPMRPATLSSKGVMARPGS